MARCLTYLNKSVSECHLLASRGNIFWDINANIGLQNTLPIKFKASFNTEGLKKFKDINWKDKGSGGDKIH